MPLVVCPNRALKIGFYSGLAGFACFGSFFILLSAASLASEARLSFSYIDRLLG